MLDRFLLHLRLPPLTPPHLNHLYPGWLQGENCRIYQVPRTQFSPDCPHLTLNRNTQKSQDSNCFYSLFFQNPELQKQTLLTFFNKQCWICISLTANEVTIFPYVCLTSCISSLVNCLSVSYAQYLQFCMGFLSHTKSLILYQI